MKVGDKKQAILLSVVAVGAIIFLFSQLGGALKGASTMPKILAAVTGSAVPSARVDGSYPEVVLRDAFSHPKLESSIPKPTTEPLKQAVASDSEAGTAKPARLAGAAPADPSWFEARGDAGAALPDPDHPEENTGKAEKENGKPEVSVKILATMRAHVWTAVVQVGSEPSRVVSKGQSLAKGIRITDIGEDGITVRSQGAEQLLGVGSEVKL